MPLKIAFCKYRASMAVQFKTWSTFNNIYAEIFDSLLTKFLTSIKTLTGWKFSHKTAKTADFLRYVDLVRPPSWKTGYILNMGIMTKFEIYWMRGCFGGRKPWRKTSFEWWKIVCAFFFKGMTFRLNLNNFKIFIT